MTDYQPITDADLEVGSAAPPQAPVQPGGNYSPIKDSDLAPGGPVPGQTSEFAYKGIPAAAAARFHASNPLANIFGAAATRYAQSWSYTFADLNAADQKTLIDNGYGNYSGPGALLQHAADAFNAGATLLKNGFLATVSAIPEAGAAIEGQIAREAGAPEATAQSAEREGGFATMAALSDVNSQIETARVQAASPGVWGHAYRVDDVPPDGAGGGEGLTHTPLGRLPDVEEAKGQAAVAADALHLPADTATLIHQTYLDTGRPPAELLLDAQTNHGGVLDKLVSGEQPYPVPNWPQPTGPKTVSEGDFSPPAVSPEGGTPKVPEPANVPGRSTTAPSAPTPEQGLSKIGLSIEQKAIDQGVTDGFLSTAGYDVKTVKGQTALVSDLITGSPDKMNAIISGEQALPKGIDPSMFIAGVESVVEQTKDWDLAARLANSPVVTRTSEAAQTLRFAQEREPDSAMAKLAELQQAKIKAVGGAEEVAKRQTQAKAVLKESNGVFLPKEELRWDKFLNEIAC